MERLGLFLFNSSSNIVDDYIFYLLDDLTQNVNRLCVVVNNLECKKSFEKYTDDVIVNSNFKIEIEIWRDLLINHFAFEELEKFDEIVLFDNSFFGPVYSFKEIFNIMDQSSLDFWTILSNGIDNELNAGNIQFIAFRNNLFKSVSFKEFWRNLDNNSTKYTNFENYLIDYFSKLNFNWKNYLEVMNSSEIIKNESFFCIFDNYQLISLYNFPLINIKPFTLPKKIHLKYHNGLDLSLTIEYINEKTQYNVSLIYKYLLKIIDPNSLVNLLNFNKIIPKKNFNTNYKSDKSIVVIAHLYYEDLFDYDFYYFKNIPEYIDIIITTDKLEKKSFIEENYLSELKNNSKVLLVNSRGRDMSGLFVGCKDIIKKYDYFCFVHDKKSSYYDNYLIGSTFREVLWENSLASEDYINSIIKSFDENESLGMVVPPRVYHSLFFTSFYCNYWSANIDEIKKLFNKINVHMELNLKESPLSIGNCFWAKFDALKPLFDLNLNYDDFPSEPLPDDGTISHALERSYGHIAASQGFYTEVVMTEYYGSNELTNFHYMFSEVLFIIRNKFDKKVLPKFVPFIDFLNRFNDNLNNYEKLIILKDNKINSILNSRSWRITKPLRSCRFKLKGFKFFKIFFKKFR